MFHNITDTAYLYLFVFICFTITSGLGQPSYDYNCTNTFNQREGIIQVQLIDQSVCQWNFSAHSGESFRLTFYNFTLPKLSECEKNHVKVKYGSTSIKHCGDHTTPYSVEYTSSSIQIRRSEHIGFTARISIVSDNTYTVNSTDMTWNDALTACRDVGSKLAETYPLVKQDMNSFFKNGRLFNDDRKVNQSNLASKYWIGMSVTPWIYFRGCVQWTRRNQGQAINLKNIEKTMCAVRCSGSTGFLLSERSCYCHNETDSTQFKFYPNQKCHKRCPGNVKERCGGHLVFTMYQYFHGMVTHETESKHCVVKVGDIFIAEDCDRRLGFTCSMTDGSNETFHPALPGKHNITTKTQHEAIQFCTEYNNSLHMSSQPMFPYPYFNGSYWTTVSRGIVWNSRQGMNVGKLSYVASYDKERDMVVTSMTNSKEKHGFICEHEHITCGEEVSGDVGNITSVNYPHHYNNYQTCRWRVSVNDTYVIQIDIQRLDLEHSSECVYDYLQIGEKNSQPIKLCGSVRQKQILTKGNDVTLTMRTDDTVTLEGFSLTWMAVKDDDPKESSSSISIYTLKGAVIAGVTFGVIMLLLVVGLVVGCVYLRNRQLPQGNTSYKSTTHNSHNALYGVSSTFASSSNIATMASIGSKPYVNLSTSRVNAMNETDTNAYETLSLVNNAATLASNLTTSGSQIHDKSGHLEMNSMPTTSSHIDDSQNACSTSISDMKAIDDIGKDSINVVSTENNEILDDGAYASIDDDKVGTNKAPGSKTVSAQNSTYNGYLNADLPSDLIQGETEGNKRVKEVDQQQGVGSEYMEIV